MGQGQGQDPSGVPVQGEHPDPFARAMRDVGVVGLGKAARGPHGDPVRRAVAGPSKAARINEGLGQEQAMPMHRLPIRRQPGEREAENP